MGKLSGFDFFPLTFDDKGRQTDESELAALRKHLAGKTTDLIFISHGFRNNEAEAQSLYRHFLEEFRKHFTRAEFPGLGQRTYTVCGLFWPSKAFSEGETKDDGGAQSLDDINEERAAARARLDNMLDKHSTAKQRKAVKDIKVQLDLVDTSADAQKLVVRKMLEIIGNKNADDGDGLKELRTHSAIEVFDSLAIPVFLPRRAKGDGDGGGAGLGADNGSAMFIGGVFKSIAGRVGQLANIGTWYMMKNRCGTVGERGLAPIVSELGKKHSTLKIHLVGHSLGGRLMASCCNTLSRSTPLVRPTSLTLLEAAFSHYGFSDNNPDHRPGFFRQVIEKNVVSGPMIATHSVKDTVVGFAYAVASRFKGDNTKVLGDENDEYGGIGRNGTQRTDEATRQNLRHAGAKYPKAFAPGLVHNLNGSNGLIADHSDVKNEHVTYAFATAVQQT